jgi:hypothetical protein
MKDDSTRQADIEVTPEMVEAGWNALADSGYREDECGATDATLAVLRAAFQASNQ